MIRFFKQYLIPIESASVLHILLCYGSAISDMFSVALMEFIFIALTSVVGKFTHMGTVYINFHRFRIFVIIKMNNEKTGCTTFHFNAEVSIR